MRKKNDRVKRNDIRHSTELRKSNAVLQRIDNMYKFLVKSIVHYPFVGSINIITFTTNVYLSLVILTSSKQQDYRSFL